MVRKKDLSFVFGLALVIMLAFIMVIIFFLYTMRLYELFQIPWSEDQAIYNQIMWNLVNCGNFSNTLYMQPNFLGVNFLPFVFLLAPIYMLYQFVSTLFLLNLIFLFATTIVIFLISYKITKNSFIAFMLGLIFCFYEPVISLATQGFRPTIISMPLFALGLLFYLHKRFWLMMFALVFASACREDVPMILLGFSLLAWLEHRDLKWKLVPGLFGFIYLFIVVSYVMPWINQSAAAGGSGFFTYSHLGNTPREMLVNMFLRFDLVVGLLLRPHNIQFLYKLLAPVFFLPVLSPFILLIPFSQYLVMFLSGYTHYASTGTYYFAPVVPFVFAALAGALASIKKWSRPWVPIVLVLIIFLFSRNSLGKIFSGLKPNPEYPFVLSLLDKIPPRATLAAQYHLVQNLSSRKEIYFFKNYPQTEYVLLFNKRYVWPASEKEYKNNFQRMLVSGDYGLVDRYKDILLFRRGASIENNGKLFVELFSDYDYQGFLKLASAYRQKGQKLKKLERTGKNLVLNNGFESVLANQPTAWQISYWQKNPKKCFYSVDSKVKNDGVCSAQIIHLDLADSRWEQQVMVKPNTYYKLSGQIKTQAVKRGGEGAYLQISEPDSKSKSIYGDTDWERVSLMFKTQPSQKEIKVWCRFGGYGAPNIGAVYFDEIILKETIGE